METSTLLSGSIIVAVTGTIIYYFGKISMPEQNNKNPDIFNYYNQGISFTLLYIILPFILICFLDFIYNSKVHSLFLMNPQPILKLITIIIPFIPAVVYSILYLIYRNINQQISDKLYKYHSSIISLILVLISIIIILANYLLFKYIFQFINLFPEINKSSFLSLYLAFSIFSITYSFISFTQIASIYSAFHTNYNRYKIYLECGMIIEGVILKYGDFIEIQTDETMIAINKEKINYIEDVSAY